MIFLWRKVYNTKRILSRLPERILLFFVCDFFNDFYYFTGEEWWKFSWILYIREYTYETEMKRPVVVFFKMMIRRIVPYIDRNVRTRWTTMDWRWLTWSTQKDVRSTKVTRVKYCTTDTTECFASQIEFQQFMTKIPNYYFKFFMIFFFNRPDFQDSQ